MGAERGANMVLKRAQNPVLGAERAQEMVRKGVQFLKKRDRAEGWGKLREISFRWLAGLGWLGWLAGWLAGWHNLDGLILF